MRDLEKWFQKPYSLAEDWFKGAGLKVQKTPSIAEARCPLGVRPTVTFDPGDQESVGRARKAVMKQPMPRICQSCTEAGCLHRKLENPADDKLLGIFGK